MATLLSDLLTVLGVRHTELYSDKRFSQMPFRSMFGLSKLLREYGVATAGISVASEDDVMHWQLCRCHFLPIRPMVLS